MIGYCVFMRSVLNLLTVLAILLGAVAHAQARGERVLFQPMSVVEMAVEDGRADEGGSQPPHSAHCLAGILRAAPETWPVTARKAVPSLPDEQHRFGRAPPTVHRPPISTAI